MSWIIYVLIARNEHIRQEQNIVEELKYKYDVIFLGIDEITEGAACTVLLARKYIDENNPLLIANCDQIVDFDVNKFVNDCRERNLDGSILVFKDKKGDKKWSFAKINKDGLVEKVREKEPISDLATVGIYLFMRGKDYINAAIDMFVHNDRTNNEFYVCPVYNYAIASGARIGVYEISLESMHGLGTPDDLDAYKDYLKHK